MNNWGSLISRMKKVLSLNACGTFGVPLANLDSVSYLEWAMCPWKKPPSRAWLGGLICPTLQHEGRNHGTWDAVLSLKRAFFLRWFWMIGRPGGPWTQMWLVHDIRSCYQ